MECENGDCSQVRLENNQSGQDLEWIRFQEFERGTVGQSTGNRESNLS